jgi:hypothetical protein
MGMDNKCCNERLASELTCIKGRHYGEHREFQKLMKSDEMETLWNGMLDVKEELSLGNDKEVIGRLYLDLEKTKARLKTCEKRVEYYKKMYEFLNKNFRKFPEKLDEELKVIHKELGWNKEEKNE